MAARKKAGSVLTHLPAKDPEPARPDRQGACGAKQIIQARTTTQSPSNV